MLTCCIYAMQYNEMSLSLPYISSIIARSDPFEILTTFSFRKMKGKTYSIPSAMLLLIIPPLHHSTNSKCWCPSLPQSAPSDSLCTPTTFPYTRALCNSLDTLPWQTSDWESWQQLRCVEIVVRSSPPESTNSTEVAVNFHNHLLRG